MTAPGSARAVRVTVLAGLAARCSGPAATAAAGPPLVMLHGAAGSSRHWRWFRDRLPEQIPAVALDLPGHGRTVGTLPADPASVVERLAAAIDCLGGPVDLVGHSWGGLLAIGLAAARPDLVRRLALVATAARIRTHPVLVEQLVNGRTDDRFLAGCFTPGTRPERLRVVVEDVGRTRCTRTEDPFGLAEYDLTQVAPTLDVPAVVVLAQGDPVVSPRRTRALAAGMPRARLVSLTGGHYLHVERPAAVAAAVLDLTHGPVEKRPGGADPSVATTGSHVTAGGLE